MEDVLDVYTRPYDPLHPVVCMDEKSKQLVADTRQAVPPRAGQAERCDYEYRRQGVCNLFLFFEPLRGWRKLKATDRRTKPDWAWAMKELVDVHYPQAKRILVVLDNLNTHTPASFYATFEPAEAKRLADRLEFHPTPKHGSWLNTVRAARTGGTPVRDGMAEIELSVLGRQCLNRRIPDKTTLERETIGWEQVRNDKGSIVDWRFNTDDARIKLKRLYPIIDA